MSNRLSVDGVVDTLRAAGIKKVAIVHGRGSSAKVFFVNAFGSKCCVTLATHGHKRSRARRNLESGLRRHLRRRPTVPADIGYHCQSGQGRSA